MDAILFSTTWHYDAFFMTAHGDIYHLYFRGDPYPLMQRLFGDEPEYREPIAALRMQQEKARAEHEALFG